MDSYFGKWKLQENINFGEFLTYYKYGWIKRKLALASYIDLSIEKTDNVNIIKRVIDSTFIKTEEEYDLTNVTKKNDLGYYKQHSMVGGEIHTQAEGNNISWQEIAKIEDNKLNIKRIWNENGIEKNCEQIFIKYTI